MRILITGTRDPEVVTNLRLQDIVCGVLRRYVHADDTIVHGACPTGVDAIAAQTPWARIESHPADWSQGYKAGPLRNQEMVDSGIDLVLAFPKGKSPGTRGTIRMAEKAGLKVIVTEL